MNNKGGVGLVVAIVLAVIVVGVLIWGLGFGGFGLGGGKGDGEGDGNIESVESEQPDETTVTTPVIEELEYIEITVSGNEYLYQNSKYTLDDLIKELTSQDLAVPVKITDENSSIKAYKALKSALADNNIHYIEAN